MAITITPTPASARYLEPVSVAIAGASAGTAYVLLAARPSGWSTRYEFTTDGSGAATVKFTPMSPGAVTFSLRPASEHAGTTTAAQTGSVTVVG